MEKDLARAKWYLWHGNIEQTLTLIEDCYLLCDDPEFHVMFAFRQGYYNGANSAQKVICCVVLCDFTFLIDGHLRSPTQNNIVHNQTHFGLIA